MTLSTIEVWKKITESGLASSSLCRKWAADASSGLTSDEASDGATILRRLVELQYLTNYQSQVLLGSLDAPLVSNGWFIRRPLDGLWLSWLEVTDPKQPSSGETGVLSPVRWVRWLSKDTLVSARAALPALPRAIQLANLDRHEHLQQAFMPQTEDEQFLVQLSPLRGQVLSDCSEGKRPAAQQTLTIVEQIVRALAHLHSKGIPHSRVLPDRIYWDGKTATLAVDPICSNCNPIEEETSGVIGQGFQTDPRARDAAESPNRNWSAQFLAPEFSVPAQSASLASDVYALGMSWLWLTTGDLDHSSASRPEILARAAKGNTTSAIKSNMPEPFKKVLLHCLAANPSSRFGSAGDLLQALDAACRIVEKGKIPAKTKRSPKQPQPAASESSPHPVTSPTVAAADLKPKVTNAPGESAAKTTAATKPVSHDGKTSRSSSQSTPATSKPSVRQTSKRKPSQDSSNKGLASSSRAASRHSSTSEQPRSSSVSPTPDKPNQLNKPSQLDSQPSSEAKPLSASATPKLVRKRRKKKPKNKWMIPVFGGSGFLVLLLVTLHFSGALQPEVEQENGSRPAYVPPPQTASTSNATTAQRSDRESTSDHFVVVEGDNDHVWLPPITPEPIALDFLPPGAGAFLAVKPGNWNHGAAATVLSAFPESTKGWSSELENRTRLSLSDIQSVVIGFYPPVIDAGPPQRVFRVQLAASKSLSEVKEIWRAAASNSPTTSQSPTLILAGTDALFSREDAEKVFSVGPAKLMQEVAELEGGSGPLYTEMERLWRASSQQADLVWLASAPFLFTDGRNLLRESSPRFQKLIRTHIGDDTKALSVAMSLSTSWYTELKIICATDQAAARLNAELQRELKSAANRIESWFVVQSPHPHWRALAFRFPQMLRTVNSYARFGVEDGVAIANCYLPIEAAPNVLLTSWIALQEGATLSGDLTASNRADTKPLSIEEYLSRPIELNFTQEPIEVALQLIADEANDALPAGTLPFRFELDGDAFEKDGITRNQQIKDFAFVQQPVRTVLTELAKRGNPVPAADLESTDQKLLWLVRPDPLAPDRQLISLTTRAAASKSGWKLPTEFLKK